MGVIDVPKSLLEPMFLSNVLLVIMDSICWATSPITILFTRQNTLSVYLIVQKLILHMLMTQLKGNATGVVLTVLLAILELDVITVYLKRHQLE